jgi:hypothetical protein
MQKLSISFSTAKQFFQIPLLYGRFHPDAWAGVDDYEDHPVLGDIIKIPIKAAYTKKGSLTSLNGRSDVLQSNVREITSIVGDAPLEIYGGDSSKVITLNRGLTADYAGLDMEVIGEKGIIPDNALRKRWNSSFQTMNVDQTYKGVFTPEFLFMRLDPEMQIGGIKFLSTSSFGNTDTLRFDSNGVLEQLPAGLGVTPTRVGGFSSDVLIPVNIEIVVDYFTEEGV